MKRMYIVTKWENPLFISSTVEGAYHWIVTENKEDENLLLRDLETVKRMMSRDNCGINVDENDGCFDLYEVDSDIQ